jgi:hypothetical protein
VIPAAVPAVTPVANAVNISSVPGMSALAPFFARDLSERPDLVPTELRRRAEKPRQR